MLKETEVRPSCLGWLWLTAACMHSTTSNCAGSTHYMHWWGTLSIRSIFFSCSWLHLFPRTGYLQNWEAAVQLRIPLSIWHICTFSTFCHAVKIYFTFTKKLWIKTHFKYSTNILISSWIFAIIFPFSVSLFIATT